MKALPIKKRTLKHRNLYFIFFVATVLVYYQLDYKRYFISNASHNKCFTVWPRLGNRCLIIPGKYYGILSPGDNYIETVTHINYIGVVWNTGDSSLYKISVFNNFRTVGLRQDIRVYDNNDILLSDYNIKLQDSSKYANINFIKREIGYEYIDLNRIWGIKRFNW